jgi:sugar lactone lactonase YvrE
MEAMTPTCIWPARALLGEAPVWHEAERRLYWLDIKGHRLRSCNAAGMDRGVTDLPCVAASLVPRRGGGFVVGARGHVATCNPVNGKLGNLLALETDKPANRFNDGKADGAGRLWIGSMHDPETEASGALYRVNPDLTWTRMDSGYVVTNGPAISPDGRTLYHTDSPARTIYAFDLAADGSLGNKRVFLRFAEDEGYPDGMTCDAGGRLWVAHWGGARVTCRNDDGTLRHTIALPTPFVTSCCFGGVGYNTLFITTASIGLAPETRDGDPLAGGLFSLTPGVSGLPPAQFAG